MQAHRKQGVLVMKKGRPIALKREKKYGMEPRRMMGYKLPMFDMTMGMECLSMTHIRCEPPIEITATELIYYGNAGRWFWLQGLLDDELRKMAGQLEFFICKSLNDPAGPWYLVSMERSAEDGDMEIILTERD
jgi:hypothetical protein